MRDGWQRLPLRSVARLDVERVPVRRGEAYSIAGVLNAGRGLFTRETIDGAATRYPALHRLHEGQLVMRKLTAWEGPITTVPPMFAGHFVSPEFPTYTLASELDPRFMRLVCQQPAFWEAMRLLSTGTVQRRKRVNPDELLNVEIKLPPLDDQRRIVDLIGAVDQYVDAAAQLVSALRTTLTMVRRQFDESAPRVEVSSVARVVMGQSPPASAVNQSGRGEPLLNGPTEFGEASPVGIRQWTTGGVRRCVKGDTLLCVRGATAGRLNRASFRSVIGRGLAAIGSEDELESSWLWHVLNATSGTLLPAAGGTIFPNISGPALRSMLIGWPERAAMEAAVGLLEALDRACDCGVAIASTSRTLRAAFLDDLLSGAHSVPPSYDRLLAQAA